MIDDELCPVPVVLTAAEVTARRKDAERELGISLSVSAYEQRLTAAEAGMGGRTEPLKARPVPTGDGRITTSWAAS